MNDKALAIIPARGGSKRIPHKNIRLFNNHPIISYPIKAAIESGCFDEVMVSTDDAKIAKIAGRYGALVPFLRSRKNSNDFAGLVSVVAEVVRNYESIGRSFKYICCIFPTAVFVTPSRIREGFGLLKRKSADAVVPVLRYSYPIQRALKIERGLIKMIRPENYRKRTQEFRKSYHDAGQFYWMKKKSFLKQNKFFMKRTLPVEIQDFEGQDIDEEQDWKAAEVKYSVLKRMK
ncbi:MAG: pseudaminic acid cytidylyltransferase [Endomicrobiales bacterium]|nr:pseudaminic acid cytidylyltransferase [Endomicrobiales bacterium]